VVTAERDDSGAERTRVAAPDSPVYAESSASSHPSRIGHYAIVGVLGEGGMGIVFHAEQENPKRAVALKAIRAGYLSPGHLRRFTQEAQVLGRLQHPGIAQVYEAGVEKDERGQSVPFFAMELIRGVPLTDYVSQKRLRTHERLDLLAKVSDAVEHAHQKGVIHRDLKPGNILVDESGQPKILDFGIARATDGDIQQTTLRTDIGQLIGTIPYMSPEQVSGDPNELDTRSDVYALGVIAYEVLSGRLPYDLHQKLIPEAARIIREEEPTQLSAVDRSLRGDVETIVAKALEKEKSRRYASAEAFASDIRRYLRNEPIAARPASTWYQIRKFSRRNTGLVAGIGLALALLVAGVLGTSVALRRALRAESSLSSQLAQTEAARTESETQRKLAEANAEAETKARKRAEAINKFVTNALQSSDPMQRGKQGTTIAEAMGNAVKEIEAGAFRDDPETEASLLGTIGLILKNDAQYAKAAPLLERALSMNESVWGKESAPTATSLHDLALLHIAQGDLAQAEPLLERSLAILEKVFGPEHGEVASGLNSLGQLLYTKRDFDRAEPLFERALAISEKVHGPESTEVALSLNDLALTHESKGEFDAAEPLLKRSLAIHEKALGPDHPDVAATLNSLAMLYEGEGKSEEAEPLFVRALAICEKALGPEHPLVATGLLNLAELYRQGREYAKAEPLYLRSIAIREKTLGPEHPEVGIVLNNLGMMYQAQGKFEEARTLFLRTLAIDEKAFGPETDDVATDLHNMAWGYEKQGRDAEAEPLYARSVAIREKVLDPKDPSLAIGMSNLAGTRKRLGKTAEARQGFDRAIEILRSQSPAASPTLARVLYYSATARMENHDAAGALPEFVEAVAMGETCLPPGHAHLAEYRQALERCKAALGK
jgi:serine/threonine protein kinase/Tfp pilus assembly protein PilF